MYELIVYIANSYSNNFFKKSDQNFNFMMILVKIFFINRNNFYIVKSSTAIVWLQKTVMIHV